MTLVEALKAHTGCKHELFIDEGGVTHEVTPDEEAVYRGERVVIEREFEKSTAGGSVKFHGLAKWLLSMPDHTRHPLNISDEEYAGFVDA